MTYNWHGQEFFLKYLAMSLSDRVNIKGFNPHIFSHNKVVSATLPGCPSLLGGFANANVSGLPVKGGHWNYTDGEKTCTDSERKRQQEFLKWLYAEETTVKNNRLIVFKITNKYLFTCLCPWSSPVLEMTDSAIRLLWVRRAQNY